MNDEKRELMRAKRAEELLAKKKKLEEMRQRKAAAGGGTTTTSTTATPADAIASAALQVEEKDKLDDFIQDILKETSSSTQADITNFREEYGDKHQEEVLCLSSLAEKLSQLSTTHHVAEVHLQPVLVEFYAKQTQTETEEVSQDQEAAVALDLFSSPNSDNIESQPTTPKRKTIIEEELQLRQTLLTENEKRGIMGSDAFEAFLCRTSRLVERAMQKMSEYDIMVDYGCDDGVLDDEGSSELEPIKKKHMFLDSRWSQGRTITSIDISSFHPELVLASYSVIMAKGLDALPQDGWSDVGCTNPDGLVLLWSHGLTARPEYVFTCQSQVLTACFHPFDRHVIIGGTYSGQIVLWDTRAKMAPIHRTPLSAKGHTHPIYSMCVVGTKNSHSLVSASTDGRLCTWNLSQMTQPTNTMELRFNIPLPVNVTSNVPLTAREKRLEVSVTSMALKRNESNELSVGTENGNLYRVQLHPEEAIQGESLMDREVSLEPFHVGHFGLVTSLQFNPLYESHQDALLLSASVDWSCKIWSQKNPKMPLFSFEHAGDYVYDVKWSPIHPALFATADGNGNLSLWNINIDTEAPVAEIKVSSEALNRIKWSPSGDQIIVGNSQGILIVYEISSELVMPKQDEAILLEKTISKAISRASSEILP